MKVKISEITEIRSGYLFRSRIINDHNGQLRVIQLKDVDESGTIDTTQLFKVTVENLKDANFLRKGDVIFKAKSIKHIAAVFNDDSGDIVATVHYFILRPDISQIIPEYLAWYLNQKPAQKYFNSNAAGTRVPIVTKKILEELEIVIPPLNVQEKIVAVEGLLKKEKHLLEALKEKKEVLVNAMLLNVVNQS